MNQIIITTKSGQRFEALSEPVCSRGQRCEFVGRPLGCNDEPQPCAVRWAAIEYRSAPLLSGEKVAVEGGGVQ